MQWVLQLGSNITEGQPEIVTDKAGNSYISFWFAKEFDIKINGIKTTLTPIGASSKTNAFIKIDTDGNVLWAHTLGGRIWNYFPKLTITDDNKIVYIGVHDKTGFDADFSTTVHHVGNNTTDGTFIAVYDTDANLQWVHSIHEKGTYSDDIMFTHLSVDNVNQKVVVVGDWSGAILFERDGATIDTTIGKSIIIMDYNLNNGAINNFFTDKEGLDEFFDICHDPRGNMLLLLRNRSGAYDYALAKDDSYNLPAVTQSYQTHILKFSPEYILLNSSTFVANTNSMSHKIFTDSQSNIYASIGSDKTYTSYLTGDDAQTLASGGHIVKFSPNFDFLMDKYIFSGSTSTFYDAAVISNDKLILTGIYQANMDDIGHARLNPDDHTIIYLSKSNYSGFTLSLPIEEHINEFPCTDYTVDLGSDSIRCAGKAITLKPTYIPEGAVKYRWSTGATTASISVKNDGQYYVTVSGLDICEQSVDSITISQISVDVDILPESIEVATKSTFTLEANAKDADHDYDFTWQSALPIINTYGQYATIKAGQAGNFSVSAIATELQTGCSAIISKNISVKKMTIVPSGIAIQEREANIAAGTRLQLHATATPMTADINGLIWTSSNTAVAEVKDGLIFGNAIGTTTIKVSNAGGTVSDEINISVFEPITPISLTLPQTAAVQKGESIVLNPVLYPTDATVGAYIWKSSNPQIASVNSSGSVTGKMIGKTVVSASDVTGKIFASTVVTVTKAPVAATALFLPETLQAKVGNSFFMRFHQS